MTLRDNIFKLRVQNLVATAAEELFPKSAWLARAHGFLGRFRVEIR